MKNLVVPTSTTLTATADEAALEISLRPQALHDFVGHEHIKDALGLMLAAARRRSEPVDHILFHGPPGTGKTTLSWITPALEPQAVWCGASVAHEMGVPLRELSAPAIRRPGDLAAVLVSLIRGHVLFLDEIHRLANESAEMLYSGMEDWRISLITGRGEEASAHTLDLSRFTLVGATTEFGLLPPPLRDRFGQVFALDLYTIAELKRIIAQSAAKFDVLIDDEALTILAERSRGTPRIANRLLRRARDLAQVRDVGLTGAVAHETMRLLRVGEFGLETYDLKYMTTMLTTYAHQPVGPQSMSAATGIPVVTITNHIEPWLMKAGLLRRTRQGRELTEQGKALVLTQSRTTTGFEDEPD